MPNGKRNIVKRLRFLAEQAQQLDQLLIRENMIFTDFIHLLIAREFMSKQHTVLKHVEITDEPEKVEIKCRHRRREKFIQPSALKVDPELLRELGRIGNNINQIAKAINTDIDKFISHEFAEDFINLFEEITNDIEKIKGKI